MDSVEYMNAVETISNSFFEKSLKFLDESISLEHCYDISSGYLGAFFAHKETLAVSIVNIADKAYAKQTPYNKLENIVHAVLAHEFGHVFDWSKNKELYLQRNELKKTYRKELQEYYRVHKEIDEVTFSKLVELTTILESNAETYGLLFLDSNNKELMGIYNQLNQNTPSATRKVLLKLVFHSMGVLL